MNGRWAQLHEQQKATGDEYSKPENSPYTGDEYSKPENSPYTGDEYSKPENSPYSILTQYFRDRPSPPASGH